MYIFINIYNYINIYIYVVCFLIHLFFRVSQSSAKEIRLLERTDSGLGALRLGLLRMGVSPHVRGGIQESLLSVYPMRYPKGN